MRQAMLTLMVWTTAHGLATAQGMYTPVVHEPEPAPKVEDCSAWRNEVGCYVSFRNGLIDQDRPGAFTFGGFATSSALVQELAFGLSDSSYYPEIVVGRDLGEWAALEGRFGTATYNILSEQRLETPSSPGVSLFIPFLDGRDAPVAGGVAGIGIQQGNLVFSYDSEWYDFGADFVVRLADSRCGRCEFLIGPAIANLNQHYGLNVSGFADADQDQPRQMAMLEDLEEWFYGIRMGTRGWYGVHRCVDLEGGLHIFLYGQDAQLQAAQRVVAQDTVGTDAFDPVSIAIDETHGEFVPRLEFQLGCRFRCSDCLAVTLAYRFDAWFGAATVDNPGLTGGEVPGTFTGQPAVGIGSEDLLTHAFLVGVIWDR